MEYLFNSKGKHIANFVSGQLHSRTGKNIGYYLEEEKIFVDRSGRYLGEIVRENRLMRHPNSPYKSINFGSRGNDGSVGNYGNPGSRGSKGPVAGFEDIPEDLLS